MCADGRMEPAEVARTITSLVSYGTLSTVDEQGMPLGTYVTFVLDERGCPIIRLRKDASHTANLEKNKKCTIFAHAAENPARQLARVTLLGEVEDLQQDEAKEAAARHALIYGKAIGVDAPQPDDDFKRLNVQDCFYVAGLGVRCTLPPLCTKLPQHLCANCPSHTTQRRVLPGSSLHWMSLGVWSTKAVTSVCILLCDAGTACGAHRRGSVQRGGAR